VLKKIHENNVNLEPSYKIFIAGHAYGNPFDTTSTGLYPKKFEQLSTIA
jgi:hypothetical protein